MNVFVVVEFFTYDFNSETTVNTSTFSTKEKAKAYFEDRVEVARLEAEEYLDAEERVESYDEDMYEVYKDGRASEYNAWIRIDEQNVL